MAYKLKLCVILFFCKSFIEWFFEILNGDIQCCEHVTCQVAAPVEWKPQQQGIVTFPSASTLEMTRLIRCGNKFPRDDVQKMNLVLPTGTDSERFDVAVFLSPTDHLQNAHRKYGSMMIKSKMAVVYMQPIHARPGGNVMAMQTAATIADAYQVLRLLSTHPNIDVKRSILIGWSVGGTSAVYALYKPIVDALSPPSGGFAAHVAFYPGTPYTTEDGGEWSDTPLLTITGALDNYTPLVTVKKLVSKINANSGHARAVSIEGAHHCFVLPSSSDDVGTGFGHTGTNTFTIKRDGSIIAVNMIPTWLHCTYFWQILTVTLWGYFSGNYETILINSILKGDPKATRIAYRVASKFIMTTIRPNTSILLS